MEVIINDIKCRFIEDAERAAGAAVAAFLREWHSPADYVEARTSGSTGAPKAIHLYKDDMRASARLTCRFFGLGAESTMLLCLSPGYIAGKMMLVRALESGARLYVEPPASAPLQHAGVPIDFAAMVPMQVQTLLQSEAGRARLASIRRLIIGGAPVSPELEAALSPLPTACYATYGMTETVSHVALRRLGDASPDFHALGDVTFSLDERGCLVINTPQFRCKRFVTNDMAELTDATRFRWTGRYDRIINSGGIKIQPEVLEEKAASCIPARFFFTSLPDDRLGEKLVLVIEGVEWEESRIAALRTRLRQLLENPYYLPREIIFLLHLSETPTGKLLRRLDR